MEYGRELRTHFIENTRKNEMLDTFFQQGAKARC